MSNLNTDTFSARRVILMFPSSTKLRHGHGQHDLLSFMCVCDLLHVYNYIHTEDLNLQSRLKDFRRVCTATEFDWRNLRVRAELHVKMSHQFCDHTRFCLTLTFKNEYSCSVLLTHRIRLSDWMLTLNNMLVPLCIWVLLQC